MENEGANLAKNIINSRKKLGLSQEALAEKTNVSLSTIQRIEKGHVKPRAFTLKALAESLEMEISDLLSNAEIPRVSNEKYIVLKRINLYTLFLVFIPFVNLIIPLFIWRKNKLLLSNDNTVGRMVSFQLLWSICMIAGVFISIFLTNLITGEAGLGAYVANIFYFLAVVFNLYIIVQTAFHLNKQDSKVVSFIPNLF